MIHIAHDASLLKHNTFGIEAHARVWVEYASEDELRQALHTVRSTEPGLPILHIGGGSNLLFLRDYEGVVLHSCIRGVECLPESTADAEVVLRVGAAEVWDDFVAYCVEKGYYGIENLSHIPGEVGASAVQNIGAYGVEVSQVIRRVECVDLFTGQSRVFMAEECEYAYRHSIFKSSLRGHYAVTHVVFALSRKFVPKLDYGGVRKALEEKNIPMEKLSATEVRRTIIDIRDAKLPNPAVQGNAGSFFMNPIVKRARFEALQQRYPEMPYYEVDKDSVKIPAGWMIERCGWKGRALGPAAVHDKQALVLVNRGGATGADILALCEAVRVDVFREFGIEIHPEVNFIA